MGEEPIVIGKILGPHGLTGAVKVLPLTSFPKRFEHLHRVILEDREGNRGAYTIQHLFYQGGCVVLQFEELSEVSHVLPFVKGSVQISPGDLMQLPQGSYYHFELLGMQVYLEDGRSLGELQEILSTGSNDVYVVRSGGREHLIPATREVIREVDVSRKRMRIHPLEGLLEHDAM
jgi:16S rRNA processing protein RimM